MQASGVILAGGKSSRMKYNKAFARIGDQAVVELILDKFIPFFAETIIITNEPELYEDYCVHLYTDVLPGLGPVGGIYSALEYASYDPVFILGCDMPFISMQLVEYMLNLTADYQAVVPELDNYLQPTAAAYRKSCLPVFRECVTNDKLKLTLVFRELDALKLGVGEIQRFGRPEELFFNVNDARALIRANAMAGRLLYNSR